MPTWQSEDGIQVRTAAFGFSPGYALPAHAHDWDQLIYASSGVMTVSSGSGTWVVPPTRALWVRAGLRHSIEMSGAVSMATLYLERGLVGSLGRESCVVHISPFLRELILHVVGIGMLDRTVPEHLRLIGVVVDQLNAIPTVPLRLPMPSDRRAARVAEQLRENPGDSRSLDRIARGVGASKRTLERLFRAETGLTFGQWRKQLRLLAALRRLAEGESVTNVALGVGYESPSAFIAMFKSALGTTPSRYYGAAVERAPP